MREIYRTIPDLTRKGERAAYCAVVETIGSTPQKAGAKLLLLPDFRNLGTLGGGCVEAEARKYAAGSLQSGERRLLEFQLDNDYGWDDGLICGGSMKIFVDLTEPQDGHLFSEMTRLLDAGVPVVMATVIHADSSMEIPLGQKWLVGLDGTEAGTVDAAIRDEVLLAAARTLESNKPQVWRRSDGAVEVFVEATLPQIRLLIAGAGYVGAAVSKIAAMCDFRVIVIDDRPEYANAENLPDAHSILVADIPKTLAELPKDELTHVVIVTRGHRHDEECLHAVVNSDAGYVGLIGSRRKIKLIFDDLRELGVSEERLESVHAPIGMDISSKTVPEIAVSIVAQLIQVRNTRKMSHLAEKLIFSFQ